MRVQILAGVLLAAGALALLGTGPAFAADRDDPVDLDGAYVLDRAGVLAGDTTAVREAIDRLFEDVRANDGYELTISLIDQQIVAPDGSVFSFEIDPRKVISKEGLVSNFGYKKILFSFF